VIATAAAAVALLAGGGWLLFLRGRSEPIAASEPPTTTSADSPTSTFATGEEVVELRPVGVDCTSELNAFPCSALTDDDPDNAWNAEAGGVGTSITFYFSPPVQITEVILYNLEDTERFTRNARIKGIEVEIDDLPQSTIAELEDSNEPQRVPVRSLRTSILTITITSAYPGQVYDEREPFYELALQEIEFFGRVAPEVDGGDCVSADVPVTVPDLVAVPEREALEILSALGVCPDRVRVEREPSPSVLAGFIVRTDPRGGAGLPAGGALTLVISAEPVVGLPLSGEWFESSLPCCGSSGSVRDLLWDGEQFLALARHPGDASVWRSEDGLTWEEVAYLGDFTTLDGPGSLDHGEAGYLVGGSVGDQATVWYSSDGEDWTQVTLGSGGVGDVAVTAAGLVAVGTSHRLTDEDWQTGEFTGVGMVWTSADGLEWQVDDLELLTPLPVHSEFLSVHALGQRVVAVGSFMDTEDAAWPLDDQWLMAAREATGPWGMFAPVGMTASQFDTTAVVHRRLVALEGPGGLLWASPDGVTWESEGLGGLVAQGPGPFYPSALTGMGETVVVAGGAYYVPPGEPYETVDPVVWSCEPDGAWRWAEGAPALDSPGGIVYLAAASLDRVVLVLDHADDRLLIWVFRPAG